MIQPTQRRLTITFVAIVTIVNAILLGVSFAYLNYSLLGSFRNHLFNDVKKEFLPYVQKRSFDLMETFREDEHFQVFNRAGNMVAGTYGFRAFTLPVNEGLFSAALSGRDECEVVQTKEGRFLSCYFFLDAQYVGRASMSLSDMVAYEQNFINLALLTIPAMLLLSYLVSRYMVKEAMKPIADIFTFQENFSSNVTHELRSPLASLKGNLEVALRKQRGAEEYRETLHLSLREVDRLIGLINNLYMLASSKFKPLTLVRRQANIKSMIDELVATHQGRIAAKGITLDMSELRDFECSCDSDLMKRAFENIVDNAIKYTPEGGLIRISAGLQDRGFVLSIANTCRQLQREEVQHIFDPFYRGANAVQSGVEGKGLGLYITRYIVRSHGGDVTVRMSPDDMCIVEVSCPLS